MRRCCSNCFGDTHLAVDFFPRFGDATGTCDYCGSNGNLLANPSKLQDSFELLLGAYEATDSGLSLLEHLSLDWGLLSEGRISSVQATRLLVDIFGDEAVATLRYMPKTPPEESPLQRWHGFRDELMWHNRFFPKHRPDHEQLKYLLRYLQALPDANLVNVFRARIQKGPLPYPPENMGPPPAELATHGRANPSGIPYLYLASDQETAVSELRPHTGDRVCVAEFYLDPGLALIDLRDPKPRVSPFAMADEDRIVGLRRELALLTELGKELTRPVLPREASIEYLPSQYICEFIKHCGFDGLIYGSSVGPGVNVALFDASRACVGSVTQLRVTKVKVEVQHCVMS